MNQVQSAAVLEMQNAEQLILTRFPDDERNAIRVFVMDQFSQLNLAGKLISAEIIANAYTQRRQG